MTRLCWLSRVVMNRHRHAIEQASRRWRGGRRGDSGRTRRKILISAQVTATSEALGKTAGKDLDADKTTYPKLMGLDGARAEAERLYQEAIDSVVPYGEAAIPLIAIAKYIVERKS